MKKVYFIIITILMLVLVGRFSYLRIFKHDFYYQEYLTKTNKIVYGINAPRGRILDRNGKVLVDNVGVNTITYYKIGDYDAFEVATKLGIILEEKMVPTIEELKDFYLETEETDSLLTEEEKKDFEYRKITLEEVEELKKSRLDEKVEQYTEEEQNIIKIYTLLNKGYRYSTKIIKKEASEKECANVNELNINGLTCEYTVKRVYLYDTLHTILGSVGSITKENKDYYLEKGYSLDDEVGLSYLEKEYDDYLKGEKAIYEVKSDNTLALLEEAKQGHDIYLSIDIDLQMQINEIIKKYIDQKDKYANTDYFNTTYVLVSNPYTGEILASSGLQKINDTYYDVTSNVLTNSFTVGSVIKGASHTVGYQNNLIAIGKKINDSCIKLYQVPMKCSYKRLGLIDDITALKTSSNYYQFLTAIKLTGNTYKANMKLNVTPEHFAVYRDTFAQFGLGSTTGIDLGNEFLGIKGSQVADDLLLNFSIGQYDTYTPLQLLNYINTIATSGSRYSLHYLKEVKEQENTIFTYEPNLLNQIEDTGYFARIQEGFKEVVYNGTGRGYTDTSLKPAGKTGTAQIVFNKDITTINQSYAMFAPYDAPKYSIVVMSPNISIENSKNDTLAPINRYIAKEVSKLVFEKQ